MVTRKNRLKKINTGINKTKLSLVYELMNRKENIMLALRAFDPCMIVNAFSDSIDFDVYD